MLGEDQRPGNEAADVQRAYLGSWPMLIPSPHTYVPARRSSSPRPGRSLAPARPSPPSLGPSTPSPPTRISYFRGSSSPFGSPLQKETSTHHTTRGGSAQGSDRTTSKWWVGPRRFQFPQFPNYIHTRWEVWCRLLFAPPTTTRNITHTHQPTQLLQYLTRCLVTAGMGLPLYSPFSRGFSLT